MTTADYKAAVRAQQAFFAGGQTKTVAFRKQALDLLEQQLIIRKESVLSALQADLGKFPEEAMFTEYLPVMRELKLCRKKLARWTRATKRMTGLRYFPSRVDIRREPRGSVLIISPWSFPFQMALLPMIDALAAGNCVVLKPAELSPHISRLLSEICNEIFPMQYVQVIEGDAQVGAALAEEAFDFIFFTGNNMSGRDIMLSAAQRLTPLSLQLGGKNPCIITASCNFDAAADQIIKGKMVNIGQNCQAPDYLLVQRQAKDSFLNVLAAKLRQRYGVDPIHDPNYPPIVSDQHYKRLKNLIGDGRIVWGGRTNDQLLKIEPTILDHINWQDNIMRQEVFGPIFPILVYDSLVTLVQQLNALPHPLTAYLFSYRKQDQKLVQQHLICGSCQINGARRAYAETGIPYGGVGVSGFGAYHGKAGFELFSYPRVTYICHAPKLRALNDSFDEEKNLHAIEEDDS